MPVISAIAMCSNCSLEVRMTMLMKLLVHTSRTYRQALDEVDVAGSMSKAMSPAT